MSIAERRARNSADHEGIPKLATEQTGCNLCESRNSRRLFTEVYRLGESEVELGIVRCRFCGLVYVTPRLTFESVQTVYQHDQGHTISHEYCWNGRSSDRRFRRLLDRLARMQPQGRLLDVGCGGGHFLASARRLGKWDVMGVEPSASAAEQARSLAECEVHACPFEEIPFEPGSLQVVTLLGVLEHLHDPLGALERVHGLLGPSGVLAVYVPNFHYLRIKDTGLVPFLSRGRWCDLHPQEHLFQFTLRSLRKILEKAGFRVAAMDVGHPFLQGQGLKPRLKMAAYHAVRALRALTGVHLGGIEAVAVRMEKAKDNGASHEISRGGPEMRNHG
jgi:SAM-dependent methyltransferase